MECQTLRTTKCELCLRPTEKLSTENRCWQPKIADVYITYLKPKLATTAASVNWTSLAKRSTFYYCQFCSDCIRAGQKLTSMKDQLKALELAIQNFVQNLSEEILKYRDELDTSLYKSADSISPNLEQFSNYSGYEIEIKNKDKIVIEEVDIYSNDASSGVGDFHCELIKEEPQVKQEIENEDVNLLTIEEDLYFSDNSSPCENQQEDDPLMDAPDGQQDNIDLNNEKQDSKPSLQNAIPPLYKLYDHITDSKVISRNCNENRQLVLCLERLPITAAIKNTMKRNRKSKIGSRKQKHLNERYDPSSSNPKQKSVGKTLRKLSKHTREVDKEVKMENDSDSDLDADITQHHVFNKQTVLEKVKEKLINGRNRFQCTPCDLEFVDSQMYTLHMEAVHGIDPVNCNKCGEEFQLLQCLRRHMEIAHPNILKCENCPSLPEFEYIYEYEIHMMTHTGEIPYECNDCHEKFSNGRTYSEHQKTSPCAIRLAKFKCDSCDKIFATKCFLLMHIAAGHKTVKKNRDGRFECGICNYTCYTLLNFQSHYSKHTEEYIYSCDICGEAHRQLGVLILHRKTHLGQCQNYTCHLCGKQFKLKSYLRIHAKAVHLEDNVTCEKCGKIFKNPRRFMLHLPDCGKSFPCEICGKNFERLSSLKKHMDVHTGESTKCHICDKTLNCKQSLKIHHEKIHLKNHPSSFVCEFCGKVIYNKLGYEQHLRNHRDEKAFECQICVEKFKYNTQLTDHNRLFHDAPLLKCKYCGAQFKTSNENAYHYKRIHQPDLEKGPFKCSNCGMCFDRKLTLSYHKKKVHKELINHFNKKCPVCGKVIVFDLNKHLKLHERDKDGPFQCDLCDRRFLKEHSLRVHKGKDHKPIQ